MGKLTFYGVYFFSRCENISKIKSCWIALKYKMGIKGATAEVLEKRNNPDGYVNLVDGTYHGPLPKPKHLMTGYEYEYEQRRLRIMREKDE